MSPAIRGWLRSRLARQAGGCWPAAALGPDRVQIGPRSLTIGDDWCATLTVVGYPREVGLGWLEPLTAHPGRLDVAVHIEPVPAALAADRLRRQLARLESDRRAAAAHGRLADPDLDVAAADARDLAGGLARGEQRLFRVGLAITVHADTEPALTDELTRVRAVCSSLLLDAQPTTWRALQGWVATLPLAVDAVGVRRTMDTTAAAAAYPFATTDLPAAPAGVLYGTAPASGGLVVWDRFGCDNHNAVILARSGAGKSYLAKLETLRWLYAGVQVAVVDPEDEYRALAAAVGGAYLHLGAPGVRLNPFDLPAGVPDALTRRALFIHTLLGVLLGGPLDPAATAAADRAVLGAYQRVGITTDPRTHTRPAPLLADLTAALAADPDPDAQTLAGRLAPYVTGSHKTLFDGPTTTAPHGQLVVLSLRDLPDELKAAGTVLTLDAVWRRVTDPADRRRRLVVVDEAWLLMRDPAGARFLFRMAKAARKHHCGLTVITQDAADLLGSDLGQAVVANAATQILLRQAPQAIDQVAGAFGLSDGERAYLLGARRGDALLAHGADRVAFTALASPAEDRLCRAGSDPTLDQPTTGVGQTDDDLCAVNPQEGA